MLAHNNTQFHEYPKNDPELTESHEDKGSSNDHEGLDCISVHQSGQTSYREDMFLEL